MNTGFHLSQPPKDGDGLRFDAIRQITACHYRLDIGHMPSWHIIGHDDINLDGSKAIFVNPALAQFKIVQMERR